ncbi:MAG: winged helix-turn-helix transcriptional regulator [Verrucomicrobia bacterium]|nr:winged helix-turn-helix transcriptional regulator [Verrucomicrobiota bacterium]
MLQGLFGNKNIQKVLLFLFVNNKCYGTQLQRLLRTPLTSLQNALARLEKGRIIVSYCEGKTKLYQLNPAYPLFAELEQLLKKTYTLLPPQDKKLYSLVPQESGERRFQIAWLLSFWERLKTVKQFTRLAQSRSKEERGWKGRGTGEVLVSHPEDGVLMFHERGSWQMDLGADISFSNTFRWILDKSAGRISL